MNRILSCCLLLLTLAAPVTALAEPERVDEVIDDLHARGYPSPTAAIDRLRRSSDVPAADAPLPARLAWHSELWPLQMAAAERTAELDSTLSALRRMADAEACQACAFELELQQAIAATGRQPRKTAGEHLDKARALLPAGDVRREQRLLAAEGNQENIAGHFNKGIDSMVRAASLAATAGDVADKLIYENAIVAMNADLGDLDRAQAMGESTLGAATALDFRPVMAKISIDLGHIYALRHQSDRQRVALERAMALSKQSPDLLEVQIMSINNLSDYYLNQPGQAQRAYDLASQGYELARRTARRASEAVALANMGISAARLGRISEGIDLLRQAIGVSERDHIDLYVVGISQELVNIYQQEGRYREALLLLQKADALQQQMTRREREVAVLDLEEKYAAAGRLQEIRRLSAENARHAAEVASKVSQQRLWAALATVLGLGLLLLGMAIRRMRILNRRLAVANGTLTEQSMVDPLTRAFNRRYGQELLGRLQQRMPQRRHGDVAAAGSVGLLLLDVDFFKHINDTHGHAAGDAVLVAIVQRLQALVREGDVVARWGGEEFLLVLPHASLDGVPRMAQRVLDAIGQTPITFNGTAIPVTVSIGSVFLPTLSHGDWEAALGLSDLALYQSKAGGRNRATCLMSVAGSADHGRLASDLMRAHTAGEVELQLVVGPGAVVGAAGDRVCGPGRAHAGSKAARDIFSHGQPAFDRDSGLASPAG